MTRVIFKYKDGREREMRESDAKILQYVRRGTYVTRDMQAQRSDTEVEIETEAPVRRKPGRPRKQPDSE